jgi:hypothetical protein
MHPKIVINRKPSKTQAMYSRYNIADVKRVRKALERTQEFREAAAAQESKVVSMR